MAFNFNWTPLTAPASSPEFYEHAKQLLTSALNKSSQSSTIVDDEIVVEELNLGKAAPEIEVLEIGDLADDKFRGVFRIQYNGDACLTLKTRIQINPLAAHLLTTPPFTSPGLLPSASKKLSIPLQVSLSSFHLNGFVILVFSRAKGITLVFRNDPLESLKVRSTFDSIPFVRDYLQLEIEKQVRSLFQEELPVAVYRLSLRLFNPDHAASLGLDRDPTEKPKPRNGWTVEPEEDPLASGIEAEEDEVYGWHQPVEEHVVRLIALVESQKTLSLFTPRMTGVVYRATAALPQPPAPLPLFPVDLDSSAPPTPISDTASTVSHGSSHQGSSSSGTRRKKRRRVVDLRQRTHKPLRGDLSTTNASSAEMLLKLSTSPHILSDTECTEPISPASPRPASLLSETVQPYRPVTPPHVPPSHAAFSTTSSNTAVESEYISSSPVSPPHSVVYEYQTFGHYPHHHHHSHHHHHASGYSPYAHQHYMGNKYYNQYYQHQHLPKTPSAGGGGILERAFMMRLVGELQKRAEEERRGSVGVDI